jgi:hypothetical protein
MFLHLKRNIMKAITICLLIVSVIESNQDSTVYTAVNINTNDTGKLWAPENTHAVGDTVILY